MNLIRVFLLLVGIELLTILPIESALAGSPDISPENTYLLAVGSCPPWKKDMLTVCDGSVKGIVSAFKDKFGLPSKNIHVVSGPDATYKGVQSGFAWLKERDNINSRFVIYLNSHGADEVDKTGSEVKFHEFFLLWTQEKPFSWQAALNAKEWMLASEIRDYLDDMQAEKIMIIDACHSGSSDADLQEHHPLLSKVNKREAFIFSALMSQLALVSEDRQKAMFTGKLYNTILKGGVNLDEAFEISKKQTLSNAKEFCQSHPEYKKYSKELCHQTAVKDDKYGLLKAMKFKN